MPMIPGIPMMGGSDGITIPAMPTKNGQDAQQTGGVDFAKALGDAVAHAGSAERAADDAGQKFAAGDPSVGIHEVMIASEKANISVKYAVSVKNKLIEAYKELLNTPL